jgi:hypothetical protein
MNTYSGTTPVSLALKSQHAAAVAMIASPMHDLTADGQTLATTECLVALADLVPSSFAAHVVVYSAKDATPSLHIDLWRGHDLHDLPEAVAALAIVTEGYWDGGRSYSLQLV